MINGLGLDQSKWEHKTFLVDLRFGKKSHIRTDTTLNLLNILQKRLRVPHAKATGLADSALASPSSAGIRI